MKQYRLINQQGWYSFKKGKIYDENYISPDGSYKVSHHVSNYPKDWALIIDNHTQKKQIMSTIKIGDKVKFVDFRKAGGHKGCSYENARGLSKTTEYVVEGADETDLRLKDKYGWFNRLQFVKVGDEPVITTTTETKPFTVEGSNTLRAAFCEEVNIKPSGTGSISSYKYLTMAEGTKTLDGVHSKKSVHFVLPKDWDAAVKYVKEYLTPKVAAFVKDGWYTVIKTNTSTGYSRVSDMMGRTFQAKAGIRNSVDINLNVKPFVTFGNGDGGYNTPIKCLRAATTAEIKAAQTLAMFPVGSSIYVGAYGVGKITSIDDTGHWLFTDGFSNNPSLRSILVSSYTSSVMQLATPTQIKAATAPKYKLCDYDGVPVARAGKISFGCRTYTTAQVQTLRDAMTILMDMSRSATLTESKLSFRDGSSISNTDITKIISIITK